MSVDRLDALWRALDHKSVFRIPVRRRLVHGMRRLLRRTRGFTALLSNAPLRKLLREVIDFDALHRASMEAVITAVNVRNGALRYFSGEDITIDHVLASAAIPVVFPWQRIDGELYWDGGLMANTPIGPALERGAREIVVVLMAPVKGLSVELPRTRRRATEWAYELSTIGSAMAALKQLAADHGTRTSPELWSGSDQGYLTLGDVRVVAVAPKQMLGLATFLDFRRQQTEPLMEAGYSDARQQLARFLSDR